MEDNSEYDLLIRDVAEAQVRFDRAEQMMILSERLARDANDMLSTAKSRLNVFNSRRVDKLVAKASS